MNAKERFHSIDWLRGLLILLMVFDHTAMYCLNGWYFRETALTGKEVPELPEMYIIRGLSHFGAPAFVMIAGLCLALSAARRAGAGENSSQFSAGLITRGLLLVAVDRLILSQFILQMPMFDIVTTIGLCMVLMSLLQRVPGYRLLAGVALLWMFMSELIVPHLAGDRGVGRVGLVAALFTGGKVTLFGMANFFNYPVLMWLPYMILGWCFGRYTVEINPWRIASRNLAAYVAAACLNLFCVIRLFNGFGNMGLLQKEGLLSFFFLSKYPPSLSFSLYAMAITGILMAVLIKHEQNCAEAHERSWTPLNLLGIVGKTPLFAYLLHFGLLALLGKVFELKDSSMMATVLIVTGIFVGLMPFCALYFSLRRKWSVLRFF